MAPVILLANTGQTLYHEMSMAMLHDKALSELLLSGGLCPVRALEQRRRRSGLL